MKISLSRFHPAFVTGDVPMDQFVVSQFLQLWEVLRVTYEGASKIFLFSLLPKSTSKMLIDLSARLASPSICQQCLWWVSFFHIPTLQPCAFHRPKIFSQLVTWIFVCSQLNSPTSAVIVPFAATMSRGNWNLLSVLVAFWRICYYITIVLGLSDERLKSFVVFSRS